MTDPTHHAYSHTFKLWTGRRGGCAVCGYGESHPRHLPTPARETAVSAATTTSGVETVDLDAVKARGVSLDYYSPGLLLDQREDCLALIAAVEALRQRVAEMERICVTVSDKNDELHAQTEAVEAHTVELAAALETLADYMAGELGAIECPPADEQSDWPRVHEARAVLTSTPTTALERARARDEVVRLARLILTDSNAIGDMKNVLAKLDALTPEDAGT